MNLELAKKIVKRAYEKGLATVGEWNTLDVFGSDYTLSVIGEQPRLPYVRRMWGFGNEKEVNYITTSVKRRTLMGHETLVGAVCAILSASKLKDAIICAIDAAYLPSLEKAVTEIASELSAKFTFGDTTFHFNAKDVCECLSFDNEDDFVKEFIGGKLEEKGFGEEKVNELIEDNDVESLSNILARANNASAKTLLEWGNTLKVDEEISICNVADEDKRLVLKKIVIGGYEETFVYDFEVVEFLCEYDYDECLWVLND